MAEPLVLTLPRRGAADAALRARRVGLDLAARLAPLAGRIADVLAENCSPESGAPATVAFLRSHAASALERAAMPLLPPGTAPLDRLAGAYALDDDEVALLLLAGLADDHEGLAGVLRSVHPQAEPRPTAGLAALLLCGTADYRPRLRHLLTEGPAVRHGLLQVIGGGPFYERSLGVDAALWGAVSGLDDWPGDVPRVVMPDPPAGGLGAWLASPAVRLGAVALTSGTERTLLVQVADETVTLARCAALLAATGTEGVAARVRVDDRRAVDTVAAHAVARGAVPVLVAEAVAEGEPVPRLDLQGVPGPVVVCAPPGTARPVGRRPVVTVPVSAASAGDRRRSWAAGLPERAAEATELAARYPIDPALVGEVAADLAGLRALERAGGPPDAEAAPGVGDVGDVGAAIRCRTGFAMPAGVTLHPATAGWDRLVLPDEEAAHLRDAVDRLRLQAVVLEDWEFLAAARADRGVRLLFSGPPGTGKSLAAEVVAAAAGADLLVVDVSRVVSKWLGETEKNLAAAFDVAERTRAVLLLDEADALFGARTEVSDAHDRYANLQTAYLLQRLDRFDGLAVLATNLRENIDPAFIRRMDHVVEFAVPDEPQRARLWRLHLPDRAPVADDVDPAVLARLYPVPGAWIRNAAIGAAFLAAAAGDRIRARHVVGALRREYAKAVRPFPGEPPSFPMRRGAVAGTRSTSEEQS